MIINNNLQAIRSVYAKAALNNTRNTASADRKLQEDDELVLSPTAQSFSAQLQALRGQAGEVRMDKVKYFEGNADAVFIMAGVCDWFFGENCVLGDVDSKDTFIYDFNLLLTLVENKYRNADIFVLIPLEPEYYMGSAALDKDYEDIQNEIRYYAANRDFKVIDLPKYDILNASNASTRQLYYKDSVHPNTQGFKMLGNIVLAEALKEINQK